MGDSIVEKEFHQVIPDSDPDPFKGKDTSNPTFGTVTTAKPRMGIQQDLAAVEKVGKMLMGDLDPSKKLKHLSFTAEYTDGTKQILYEHSGHAQVEVISIDGLRLEGVPHNVTHLQIRGF